MASNSSEALVVGLYDRGEIGYATSKESRLVGRAGGYVELNSGRLSPNYVNLRRIPSLSSRFDIPLQKQIQLRKQVIQAYNNVIDGIGGPDWEYSHLMGIPHSMTALGAMIGLTRGESVLSMRTEAKDHGISKMIEGDYADGEVVLGLDDVVSDGATKVSKVEAIRREGLYMDEFVVLVDRQEGGVDTLNQAGIKIYSSLTMGGITAILKANRRISDEQVSWTADYYNNLVEEAVIKQMPVELAGLV